LYLHGGKGGEVLGKLRAVGEGRVLHAPDVEPVVVGEGDGEAAGGGVAAHHLEQVALHALRERHRAPARRLLQP
jgi:hypothetical protein